MDTKMKDIKVKVELEVNRFRIYVNGIIHISFNINDFVGIQSYFIDRKCHIDFHLKDTTIEAEYTRMDLWHKILDELKTQKFI